MYVLIVYDIEVERVNKIHKYLKTHLNWIQNSVFEGHLTKAQFKEVELKVKKIIDKKFDSILIFSVENQKSLKKQVIGIEKNPLDVVI